MLRVIASMNPKSGGPCQGIRNSIPSLKKYDIETEVVSFDMPQAEFIKTDDFVIHALGPARSPYSYASKLVPWLKKHLGNYDAVMIHGMWLYNSYGTFKTWSQMKMTGHQMPALFLMPHGMLDPYFQKAKGRKLKALRNVVFWKLFEQKVINGVDAVLFTCREELILAQASFKGYKPQKAVNIGYGIQAPPYTKEIAKPLFLERFPEFKGKEYWLFLSRIHPKKGLDLLIQAYKRLVEKQVALPILLIAGPGMNTAFGKQLRRDALGLPIHFVGMLENELKWGALYGAKHFILPSYQENFGIAVVEALACATPVVISDQVNIWREIKKAGAGLICKTTVDSLEQSLRTLLFSNKEEEQTARKDAYACYRHNFLIDNVSSRFKSILTQELNINDN